jgi:hypothetical protein
MSKRLIAGALCAGLLSVSASSPALADGAASTRNIIFGAAAAGVGTWAIINHNKKVHQKIDEKDAQIHSLDQQRSDAETSYESEHQRYLNAVAEANHYKVETASLKRQVASLQGRVSQTGAAPVAARPAAPVAVRPAAPPLRVASVSYGWGQL